MPRWRPDPDHVEDQEAIGRRVYSDKILRRDGRLRVDHFEDSRLDNDLSVDRLGNPNPMRAVKAYLAAKASAANPDRSFAGWAALRVSAIRNHKAPLEVIATPKEDNEYHADICRDRFRDKVHAYNLAIRLKEAAESTFGFVEAP